ncbi:mucin-2 [Streptacidiphilus sp. EB103A]|uniref:mucin-2 n=1 Tax=Streptacidiphilus sp. EB103A TaxID=3156275 RepID=UPI003512F108
MRSYATALHIGDREYQCDATAVHTAPDGTRAHVLLDGIGDRESVRAWTRATARRLARSAARCGDGEKALRRLHAALAGGPVGAAAVVAVTAPGRPLALAWCGDSRAYLLGTDGTLVALTRDHNLRRAFTGGNRHRITSYLGSPRDETATVNTYGHPAIETATAPATGRLALLTDGGYEPHEDTGEPGRLASLLTGTPATAARALTHRAVADSRAQSRARRETPFADNATALVADLHP